MQCDGCTERCCDCGEYKQKLAEHRRRYPLRKMSEREIDRRSQDALGDLRDAQMDIARNGPNFEERDEAFYRRAPRQNPTIQSRSRR